MWNTLRWDKTSCHHFEANQARLEMGTLAYNLLHMLREFQLKGEDVKRSIEWVLGSPLQDGAWYRLTGNSRLTGERELGYYAYN